MHILWVPPLLKTYIIILFFFENLYKYIFRNLLSKCEAIFIVFFGSHSKNMHLNKKWTLQVRPAVTCILQYQIAFEQTRIANTEMKAYLWKII